MHVFVTGATGLIGRALCPALLGGGHLVTALSRAADAARRLPPGVRVVAGDPTRPGPWQDELARADACVHLAGEPLEGRWTAERKRRFVTSRVDATRNVADVLRERGPVGARLRERRRASTATAATSRARRGRRAGRGLPRRALPRVGGGRGAGRVARARGPLEDRARPRGGRRRAPADGAPLPPLRGRAARRRRVLPALDPPRRRGRARPPRARGRARARAAQRDRPGAGAEPRPRPRHRPGPLPAERAADAGARDPARGRRDGGRRAREPARRARGRRSSSGTGSGSPSSRPRCGTCSAERLEVQVEVEVQVQVQVRKVPGRATGHRPDPSGRPERGLNRPPRAATLAAPCAAPPRPAPTSRRSPRRIAGSGTRRAPRSPASGSSATRSARSPTAPTRASTGSSPGSSRARGPSPRCRRSSRPRAATRTPLTFRAAGTSLSGQAVTDSILVQLDGWKGRRVLEDGRAVVARARRRRRGGERAPRAARAQDWPRPGLDRDLPDGRHRREQRERDVLRDRAEQLPDRPRDEARPRGRDAPRHRRPGVARAARRLAPGAPRRASPRSAGEILADEPLARRDPREVPDQEHDRLRAQLVRGLRRSGGRARPPDGRVGGDARVHRRGDLRDGGGARAQGERARPVPGRRDRCPRDAAALRRRRCPRWR